MKYIPLITILISAAIIASGCVTTDAPDNINQQPEILEYTLTEETDGEIIDIIFPFKNHIIKKQTAVSTEKYKSLPAKDAETRYLYAGEDHETKTAYFQSFINDPANKKIFDDLLNFFDLYAENYSLTSDEYAELAVSYVQNITYISDSETPKFPIETIYENSGDCDDKSLLLTGLLSQKGYDVALLFFEEEEHMTAGIKSGNETQYPDANGYSMIELTGSNFIGETSPSLKLTNNRTIILKSTPEIFKIGSGTKTYTASGEVAEILKMRETAIDKISETENQINNLTEKIKNGEALSEQIADTEILNAYIDLHNKCVKVANMITEQPFNRKFVYSGVKNLEEVLS